MQNRIVCAANRNRGTGVMLLGIRHWDRVMSKHWELLEQKGKPEEWEQGFIDRLGAWHNRENAYVIAEAANQILRPEGGPVGTLYSEHLY